jgi:hypothetical protein
MPGISNRIVSFANFYNQLKTLVVVISPFVKQYAGPLQRGDISKMGWGHLKIFSRIFEPEELKFI